MPTIIKRMLALSLVLILSFTFIGCAEEERTEEEIVAKAAITTAAADSYEYDMDVSMTIEVIGGTEPGEMTMVMDVTGTVDNANKEAQMTMDTTMDVPGLGEEETAMEAYIVGEWMYMMTSIPEVGEQWIKMRLTEEMWELQCQFAPYIGLLETATEVNLLGSEDVSGTACYVMETAPSMEALSELLSQQQALGGIDWGELDLADIFKEMSVKQWIAKDSYLLMKAQIHMLMEMSPGDVGATEEDFEKLIMDMDIETKFYDYNQAVSIELPEEALEAPEIPGS